MDVTGVRRADRRGLANEAADRIRSAIFDGSLPPGSALREVELATALEVSRGSVREGLTVLQREGLLRSAWHRGTTVIELTEADAREIYDVRAALDRLAAVSAADRADAGLLDALDGAVRGLAEAVADDAPGERLLDLDLAFHDLVYAAADNGRLTDAWQAIRSQVCLFQLARVRLEREHYRTRVVAEHRELAALIREGGRAELADVAHEHVASARRALIAHLAARPD